MEFDDCTIGRALSSPLFQERALDKFITLLTKACCPVSRRLSVMLEQGDLFSMSLDHWFQTSEKIHVATQKVSKSGFFSNDKKRADSRCLSSRDSETWVPGRLWQKKYPTVEWKYRVSTRRNLSCSSRRRTTSTRSTTSSWTIIGTKSGSSWSSWEKSHKMEELKRFQGSTFDTISGRRLIADRDTILELTGKIQELQNEIHCLSDSADFQDAESVRSGQSHVTSQPVFFPPHPNPGGLPGCSLGMPNRNNGPPSIGDTHGVSGNVFANPTASSSAPYQQESNPWISNVSEHTCPHVMSESQKPAQDERCQPGPSARNSVVPSEGRFSKNYGADQQRLQISDLHFDKFSTPATFACWKIRFKTEECTCSQFPTEAMLWIKEVEMVDSVDDLKSKCSVRGIQMPNFEVLDAKIASTEPNHPYSSTGNLSSCFFFNLGGLIFLWNYSFWRRSNYFLSSWRVTVFDPGGINIFLFMQFFPLCGLSCLHFYQEWNVQPLWKVKRLEQYTSWKVRVPDCVFSWEILTPTCAYAHTHTQLRTHTFIKNTCSKTNACTRLGGW